MIACPRRISQHDTRDVYRRRWGKLLRRATSVVGLFSNALLVKAHDLHWRYNTPTTIHGHSPLVELSWTAEYPVSRSVRAFSALIFASISSVRMPASSEVVCPKTSSRKRAAWCSRRYGAERSLRQPGAFRVDASKMAGKRTTAACNSEEASATFSRINTLYCCFPRQRIKRCHRRHHVLVCRG